MVHGSGCKRTEISGPGRPEPIAPGFGFRDLRFTDRKKITDDERDPERSVAKDRDEGLEFVKDINVDAVDIKDGTGFDDEGGFAVAIDLSNLICRLGRIVTQVRFRGFDSFGQ